MRIRKPVVGAGIVLGLIAVLILAVGLLFDLNRFKPQIEAYVSRSTGMQLKIDGKAALKFIPLGIVFDKVHLTDKAGKEVLAASEIRVSPRVGPLVSRRELVADKLVIVEPKARLEAKVAPKAPAKAPAQVSGQVQDLSIQNGELTYLDVHGAEKVRAKGVNASFSKIARSADAEAGKSFMSGLTFKGDVKVKSIDLIGIANITDLKSNLQGDRGLLRFDPVEAKVYGGSVHGSAQLDARKSAPQLSFKQSFSQVDLSKVYGKPGISGLANGSVSMQAGGGTPEALIRSSRGTLSIRSHDVTLAGVDADDLAGKLKTSQGMGLASLGSSLMSGFLAPAAREAAGVSGEGPKTVIKNLVSDWKIGGGIAETQDVAFSTEKNTIAFKGKVNLLSQTYQGFSVATVDERGCAKNKVAIEGPLKSPHPTAASVGQQIAKSYPGQLGSAMGALGSQIGGFLDSGDKGQSEAKAPAAPAGCDLFYSGAALRRA